MFREVHRWNRANLPSYFEVYLTVALDEFCRSDPKGSYRRFDAGELINGVGLDLVVDAPHALWVVEFDPARTLVTSAVDLFVQIKKKREL